MRLDKAATTPPAPPVIEKIAAAIATRSLREVYRRLYPDVPHANEVAK